MQHLYQFQSGNKKTQYSECSLTCSANGVEELALRFVSQVSELPDVSYDEIRIDTRSEGIINVWVLVTCNIPEFRELSGWHYRAFSAERTLVEIMLSWGKDVDVPELWRYGAPGNLPIATGRSGLMH